MRLDDINHCFYVPAPAGQVPSMIDVARVNDAGQTVTYFHGETLEALRERYPTAVLATVEEFDVLKEAALRTDPVPTTKEIFWEMLEVLPPLGYRHTHEGESFKMVERYSGRMTNIYARIGDSYWTLMDCDSLPHDEIMAKVKAIATA